MMRGISKTVMREIRLKRIADDVKYLADRKRFEVAAQRRREEMQIEEMRRQMDADLRRIQNMHPGVVLK